MIAAFDNPGSILNISGVSSRKIIDICADMFPFCISYTESDLYTMKKKCKDFVFNLQHERYLPYFYF